jgi:DNA-binding NtrC family response regulator
MEKVLVVEDEKDVREVVSEMLKGWGYEPVVAENGKVGLDMFRSHLFSLVITDIRMPVMDGLDMLKLIRKDDPKIPIVVITGYPTVDSAVESLVEGADYYIVKPINMDDLKAKIHKAFEKRKIQRVLTARKRANIILLISVPIWILLGYFISKIL